MINQEKSLAAGILPHVGAILCFLVVTFVYFSPILDGKVLMQSDVTQYIGMSQELRSYYEQEGESSAWTGSMFSGMPAYQIGVWGSNPNLMSYVEMPLRWFGGDIAGPVFTGMLMAYILFIALGFGIVPSILGAFAFSFCSYNIIIIEAGHVTKAWTIAYMPLIIAGLLTALRKKYLLGGLLMALGLALQIRNNHLQITYYTGILCAVLYIGFLLKTFAEKKAGKHLIIATGVLVAAATLAVLSNASNFYSNYEMAEESIRGQSELSQPTESEKQSSGLDKDYAFNWSYGKAETFSLLVPDIHGGASGSKLGASSNVYQQLRSNGQQLPADGIPMPTYWGDQPFTSGPVYFGAIICFLFVLGMLLIRHSMKWTLLAATILFVFLSWGKNLEGFNDWFFYHFPLYNKFRSVSMALVVPTLTMLITAVWGLKEFLGLEDEKKRLKALYIAAGVVGGLCLFFWLLPGFCFNFTSAGDERWKSQYPEWFYNALLQDRKDLLSSDAGRSLVFILLAAVMLWGAVKLKAGGQKTAVCTAVLAALVLIDLWGVDKRYLNNDMFQNKTAAAAVTTRRQTNADKFILQDKGLSHRVLNLNDPFNETNTSYFHKSIGGYHAAKLKRYQELIEYHIVPEMGRIIQSSQTNNLDSVMASFAGLPALNMLNAKYIIYSPEQQPLINPYALGNAWFVREYAFVDNADAEIKAIGGLNPATTAIVDKRFEQDLAGLNIAPDSTAAITMLVYKPDRVEYTSESKTEGLAVFSEVYYANGWEATIDGQSAPHFCADWTLRAMRIPAGKHTIAFEFVPHGYYAAVITSRISSGLLIVFLLLGIGSLFYKRKERK